MKPLIQIVTRHDIFNVPATGDLDPDIEAVPPATGDIDPDLEAKLECPRSKTEVEDVEELKDVEPGPEYEDPESFAACEEKVCRK
jgi:hypothetical protein